MDVGIKLTLHSNNNFWTHTKSMLAVAATMGRDELEPMVLNARLFSTRESKIW